MLWAPITSHCAWERVPGLQIFQCVTDTPQEADCEGDACAQIETPSYKITDTQTSVPVPPLALLIELPLLEQFSVLQALPVTTAPPEIPIGWQFSCRAAPLPRAPSCVS